MIQFLLNLLFPAKCLICNSYHTQTEICGECWGKFTFITKPYCSICSYPFAYENDSDAVCGYCIIKQPNYDKALSILKYDQHSKNLIHKFKYQDQLHILNYFARLMSNMGKDLLAQADIILPVAMHQSKLLKRGYNQAALLAMKIASTQKLQYLPQLLIKIKNVQPQAGLTKEQRSKNIKNTFQLNEKFLDQARDKTIILVDDVITTGATIDECCKVLKKAKPKQIFVLTLAKRL